MTRKHRILLVEDRQQDVHLIERALLKAGYDVDLDIAVNGRMALDRLQRTGQYKQAPLPDLVLLDLIMPILGGIEVLQEMKQDPLLRLMPVIVLTTSNSEGDVKTAHEAGCNAYIPKPVNPDQFQRVVEALGLFWLETALLPS